MIRILLGFSLIGSTWVLYILLILSILSIALIVSKYRFFKKNSIDFELYSKKVEDALEKEGIEALEKILDSIDVSESRILKAVLMGGGNPGIPDEEVLARAIFRERLEMERGLSFLGTLGNNAPFIGLFGTVLGIIKAFHDLSIRGNEGPQVVMAGISEALIATAIGLLVAIPAVIAYNYFQRRIKVRLAYAEMLGRSLISAKRR